MICHQAHKCFALPASMSELVVLLSVAWLHGVRDIMSCPAPVHVCQTECDPSCTSAYTSACIYRQSEGDSFMSEVASSVADSDNVSWSSEASDLMADGVWPAYTFAYDLKQYSNQAARHTMQMVHDTRHGSKIVHVILFAYWGCKNAHTSSLLVLGYLCKCVSLTVGAIAAPKLLHVGLLSLIFCSCSCLTWSSHAPSF